MFRFEHSYILFGLLLIPLCTLIFIMMLRWKKKALNSFGDAAIIDQLMPDKSESRPVTKFVFLMLAFVFLILAGANPQIGSKLDKIQRKGVDLMIALDVSNSMLAEDIKPNRLERAKQALSKLIDRLENDRIGIIVFAGKAYTQLPITSDYAAAKMYLSLITTGIVPTQGTAIGDAIKMAEKSFKKDERKNKAIIIITDGENHEDDAVEAAKEAQDNGIIVHTLGMGLPEGGPIPMSYNNGQITYKKDRDGNTVITKLDETQLQKIASAGKGKYIRANNTEAGLNPLFDEIEKMEKKDFDSKIYSEYESRYQYFLGFGLLLLLVEFFIIERRSKWVRKLDLFGDKPKLNS